ncbi:putative epoxide hydrolase [Bimuria novae-zelandiae CBS 107.79]|uniref:Putative epoxide hydrolase n=1 Tax=Bimuria novae-zelandiae CBS 107.79 TaxID=1447943 RepID=A0A6A5V5S3_9PLEO|nr:putative epoxide hydrolase [Bimuria novae-zelandiae CBS 107.79]
MAAEITVKTLGVTGGHTYSYTIAAPNYGRGTYLLLHGFPSASYDWRHIIEDLTAEGYGIVAPDLLGYGNTSKPTAVEEYAQEDISCHVAEILEHEGISGVVGVGHDWGAGLLSSMWYYHPQLFESLVFMATPYSPVSPNPIDLSAINTRTEKAFGYPIYGYWTFFNQTDAASIIERHHDSFTTLLYPEDPAIWKTIVCPIGKLRAWLEADKETTRASYISDEEWDTHSKIMLNGGYTGPLNWYKAAMAGLNKSPTLDTARQAITKRTIFISGENDAIGRPEIAQQTADEGRNSGLLPNVETFVVPGSSHWMQVEKSKEVLAILKNL